MIREAHIFDPPVAGFKKDLCLRLFTPGLHIRLPALGGTMLEYRNSERQSNRESQIFI